MSDVTDVVLSFSIMEEREEDLFTSINAFFAQRRAAGFAHLRMPVSAYGGSKSLQHFVLVGAFNYLDEGRFISHLKGLNWVERENVQLFLHGENDDRFRVVTLKEAA